MRLVYEVAPQLLFQSTILMCLHEGLLGQPVLLFSLALSCLVLLKKLVGMTRTALHVLRNRRQESQNTLVGVALVLVFSVLMWLFLLYILLKLLMLELCPSHT